MKPIERFATQTISEIEVNYSPHLSEDFTKRIAYYSFCGEKLLFVNVERDFGRVAPLCEAALAYSSFQECSFVDIARLQPKRLLKRINLALYDSIKGGYMPKRISKILLSKGINVISNFENNADQGNLLEFTIEEEKALLMAIRNENNHISLVSELIINELKTRRLEAARTVNSLARLIKDLGVNRTFVWNGRFFNSTLVEIASMRAGAKCSKIEFGASVDKTFDVCRESSSSLIDQSRKFFAHFELDDRTKPINNFGQYLVSRASNPYTERFDSIGIAQFPKPNFFTFYLTSYFEAILEDVPGLPTQEQCVLATAHELALRGMQLVIRLHPNPRAPEYETLETEYWNEFISLNKISNCKIVEASSEVDSYQLSEFSIGSLCYVSTIGLELSARGRPCLYLIKQPWESDFGMPENHQILIDKLSQFIDNPTTFAFEQASGYINFLSSYGFKYKYLKKQGVKIYFEERRFMKERSNEHLLMRIPIKIKKVFRSCYSLLSYSTK